MATKTLYVTMDQNGLVRQTPRLQREMGKINNALKGTQKTSKGIIGEFEKIPRRLIVAGGAALAFRFTLGAVSGVLRNWNQLIDQAGQKLQETADAMRNLVQMMPAGLAAQQWPELVKEAEPSPLLLGEMIPIREAIYSMLTPEKGFGAPIRREAELAAREFVRARGLPGADVGMAIGKGVLSYRKDKVSPTEIANMISGLMTQAALISGEEPAQGELAQLLKYMPRVTTAGAELKLAPDEVFALLTGMTEVTGSAGKATMGTARTLEYAKSQKGKRVLGLTGKEDVPGLMGALSNMPLETGEEFFGRRYWTKARATLRGEGGSAETVQKMLPFYAGLRARKDLVEQTEWEKKLAADPNLRRAEQDRILAELDDLRLLHEDFQVESTLKHAREAYLSHAFPASRGGAAARSVFGGLSSAVASLGGEEAAGNLLRFWGRHSDWDESAIGAFEDIQDKVLSTRGVPPPGKGVVNLNMGLDGEVE